MCHSLTESVEILENTLTLVNPLPEAKDAAFVSLKDAALVSLSSVSLIS